MDHARFYVILKVAYLLGICGHPGYLVNFWVLDLQVLAAFNVLSVAISILALWQHTKGSTWPDLLLTLFEVPAHAFLATMYVGVFSAFWALIFLPISIGALVPFIARPLRYSLCVALTLIMIAICVLGKLMDPLQVI